MTSEASWEKLAARCLDFITDDNRGEFPDLMITLTKAAKGEEFGKSESHVLAILSAVIEKVRGNWDESGQPLASYDLNAYVQSTLLVKSLAPMPKLDGTWREFEQIFQSTLAEYEDTKALQPDNLYYSLRAVNAIRENEPRFLRRARFPESFLGALGRLLQLVSDEVEYGSTFDDDLRVEAERLDTIANLLAELSELAPSLTETITPLVDGLNASAVRLREKAAEGEPQEPDPPEEDREYTPSSSFDVDGLFSDL
jgi:hypothetical protein